MKPEAAETHSDYDRDRALASLDAYTDRFVALLDAAEGRDLNSVAVRSPFLVLMRLPLGTFAEALGLHAIRHAQQAERVTKHPSFPG
jgi:hypothetical protein